MLSDALCEHPDVQDVTWSADAELDAAQLLAGRLPFPSITGQMVCLQTTYLNERFQEYFAHRGNYRLIWLVRNPNSVVYSMVYNWKRFALNEVFEACGVPYLDETTAARYRRFGVLGVPPIKRAACAYIGKAEQAKTLYAELAPQQMVLVEYEHLVSNKPSTIAYLTVFCGLPPFEAVGSKINTKSLGKAKRLSLSEASLVTELCGGHHQELIEIADHDLTPEFART